MSNVLALKCWSCKAEFTLKERSDCDGCCWKCGVEIDLEDYAGKFAGEVERLRAEVDKLQLKVGQSFWDKQDRDDTIDDLRGKMAERDALRSFANEIISAAYEGGSFEGGDIQDMAVKHGLLRIESRAEECGEPCACREYGFPAECYRKTALLSAIAEPSAPKCKSCGQVPEGQGGEYPCKDCGLPTVHDEPSAPVEIDDLRIHLEAMCKLWPEDLSDDGSGRMGFKSEVAATVAKARAALVRKP